MTFGGQMQDRIRQLLSACSNRYSGLLATGRTFSRFAA